jgi:hypothetical protein
VLLCVHCCCKFRLSMLSSVLFLMQLCYWDPSHVVSALLRSML